MIGRTLSHYKILEELSRGCSFLLRPSTKEGGVGHANEAFDRRTLLREQHWRAGARLASHRSH